MYLFTLGLRRIGPLADGLGLSAPGSNFGRDLGLLRDRVQLGVPVDLPLLTVGELATYHFLGGGHVLHAGSLEGLDVSTLSPGISLCHVLFGLDSLLLVGSHDGTSHLDLVRIPVVGFLGFFLVLVKNKLHVKPRTFVLFFCDILN